MNQVAIQGSNQPMIKWLMIKQQIKDLNGCPKPSSQPRDAARREECLQLDEKSLTTFLLLNGRAKGSGAVHLK